MRHSIETELFEPFLVNTDDHEGTTKIFGFIGPDYRALPFTLELDAIHPRKYEVLYPNAIRTNHGSVIKVVGMLEVDEDGNAVLIDAEIHYQTERSGPTVTNRKERIENGVFHLIIVPDIIVNKIDPQSKKDQTT